MIIPFARARVSHERDPALESLVAIEARRMVLGNRYAFTCGFVVYVAVFTSVLWSEFDHTRLLVWDAFAVVVLLIHVAVFLYPGQAWIGPDGLPRLFRVAGYGAGVLVGSLFWVDVDALAHSASARAIGLCAVLAMSVVMQTPTIAVSGHSLRVQTPMLLLACAASPFFNTLPLTLGLPVLLAVVIGDVRRSRTMVLDGLRARAAAQRESVHDPLTGLANRTGLLRAFPEPGLDPDPDAPSCTVIYVDLDRFKQVNDRYGHAAGDELLRQAASRLQECCRAQDVVARLGGDEFVVFARGLSGQEATLLGERVIATMELPFLIDDRELLLSASVGITTVPVGPTPAAMLADADRALYKAKHDGRRRVVRYDTTLGEAVERRATMEAALRRAIRGRLLQAHAQPIFCLATGRIVSVELLVRWVDQGRYVEPADFVALAEEIGMIRDLGTQMLDHAVQAIHDWKGVPGLCETGVAVNISPRHVVHGLLDDLAAILADPQVPPSRLTIEITEQLALPDEDGTKEVLDAVVAAGVEVAIDDFGTGFSSIRWLTALPAGIVKLDRSLLTGAGFAPASAQGVEFLRSVQALAHSGSRTVVAEGIETLEELRGVREAGIPLGQGYLLARPMPLATLAAEAEWLCTRARELLAAGDLDVPQSVIRTPENSAG